MMKKKSLVLAAVMAACATSFAFATPQTQWNQGQWQLDLGAWNPKASVDSSNWAKDKWEGGQEDTDSKWDFQGGLGYGLTDNGAYSTTTMASKLSTMVTMTTTRPMAMNTK